MSTRFLQLACPLPWNSEVKVTNLAAKANRAGGEVSPNWGNPRLTWVVPWDSWAGLWGVQGRDWAEP